MHVLYSQVLTISAYFQSLLKSIHTGKPLIGTKVGDIPEIKIEGET